MPTDLPSVPDTAEIAGVDPKDEIDPELVALPDPPKAGRTWTLAVLALAALASLAMVFALRRDVAYALGPSTATSLGDLRTVTGESLASLENRPVSADAMLGAAGGIRYERPFAGDTFRALPVAGRDDVWVEVRVPEGQESGRWEPPRSFSGRLVRFRATGPRHRGLAGAIAATTKAPVSDGAWLLVDGEDPSGARWSLALALMFLGFAGWNVFTIARLVRKVA